MNLVALAKERFDIVSVEGLRDFEQRILGRLLTEDYIQEPRRYSEGIKE
jgi:hypothetical protein